MSKIFKGILLFTLLIILGNTKIYAQAYDFSISNNTTINYKTGDDYVVVTTEYIREVRNSSYFYSAQGEKIFHIPDLPKSKEYELKLERQFKKESLKVTDSSGRNVSFSIEDLPNGEGMYVKVPNYKQTVYGSPYRIYLEYKTHDLVKRVYGNIVIMAPGLHKDTQFQQTDTSNGTSTSFSYDLKIVVDKDIPILSKIYPANYKKEEAKDSVTYSFDSKDRLNTSPYLEFGTSQIYRFELKYKTPKTDAIIPTKYSSISNILSANIYELSLPREYSETNQRVKIESISPKPIRIYKDSEGNIFGKFEVPANREGEITVNGYIYVEQNKLEDRKYLPNTNLNEYLGQIAKDSSLKQYTLATKYWEVNDQYIQDEANKLSSNSSTISDLIKKDYRYINDRLEYDESKANSDNERIGAKAALMGGGSVCMEYADSMIAILRAQGIPARAALGYSNLDTLQNTNSSGSTRHQWVQVWIPEYGWMSIDPTYESENMLIGQSIDKVLWETFYSDTISSIKIYSADKSENVDFTNYSVKIYAVPEVFNEKDLLNYSDIQVVQSENTNVKDSVNTFVKTTILGKSMIIVAPILLIILVSTLVISLIRYLLKKVKNHKSS